MELLDRTPRLDIHALHRVGALQPGVQTEWRDQSGIRISVRAESFGRLFVSVDGGAELEITLIEVPGTLGGTWSSTACPSCGVRRWHLYIHRGAVACRQCLNLRYGVRHQFRSTAKLLKASRLRAQLVTRPMLSRKRSAILAQIAKCEAAARDRAKQMVKFYEKRRLRL